MHDDPNAPAPVGPGRATYVISEVPREVVDYWLAQPAEARHSLNEKLIGLMTALVAPVPPRGSAEVEREAWAQLKLEADAWRVAFHDWPETDIGWLADDFQQPIHDALAGGMLAIEQAFVVGAVVPGELQSLSDIDLVVVGTAEHAEVVRQLLGVEQVLARKLHIHLYAPKEWAALCHPTTGMAEWLAAGPKFWVWPEVKVLW